MSILPVASGRSTLAAFGRLLGRYPMLAAVAVSASIAASGAAVAVPILLGRLVDHVAALPAHHRPALNGRRFHRSLHRSPPPRAP